MSRGLVLARNIAIACAVIAGGVTAIAFYEHVSVNLTNSMPIGIYQRLSLHTSGIHRNQLVIACMPTWALLYRRASGLETSDGTCPEHATTILKILAGLPGDRITVNARGVSVNGRLWPNTPVHATNSRGQTIPHAYFGRTIVLKKNQYWLLTPSTDGFDSRYFGPVTSLLYGAKALWTVPALRTFVPSTITVFQ